MDPADPVLRDFSCAECGELPLSVSEAAEAAERLVSGGLLPTQQHFHSR